MKSPLTLTSPVTPRREEGKHNEIEKEIPFPLRGEGEGDLWDYFTASGGGKGGFFPLPGFEVALPGWGVLQSI